MAGWLAGQGVDGVTLLIDSDCQLTPESTTPLACPNDDLRSGPSLNILIKLSAIISLVFAPAFPSVSKGGLIVQLFRKMA